MLRLILKRIVSAIPLLLILSLVVYLLLAVMGGDAARIVAGEDATEADVEATRQRLGLDQPIIERYLTWIGHAIQGDLGTSWTSSQSVTSLILDRVPVTFSLTLVAMVFAVVLGLPAGVLSAIKVNSIVDRVISAVASVTMAVPPFVIGLGLVIVFAVNAQVLPATGYTPLAEAGVRPWFNSLVLPAAALAFISAAELLRQTRAAMVDTLERDYIRTVRAKGMRTPTMVGKHALKNAGVPIVTVVGLQVGRLLAGAVTVETVFALPGLGTLAVNSAIQRDAPVLLGVVMVSALLVLSVSLIVDMSYAYFNPRLRR